MGAVKTLAGIVWVLILTGCSAKDPVTQTPVYHIGTPTNRASVNSWELNQAGVNIQPGRYAGKPVTLPNIPSQRGFEPGDPLALTVRHALTAGSDLPTRYLSVSAKNGIVLLEGSVTSAAQKAQAEQIARQVRGVHTLRSQIVIIPAR